MVKITYDIPDNLKKRFDILASKLGVKKGELFVEIFEKGLRIKEGENEKNFNR